VKVGKAVAMMQGRSYVTPDDIKAVALPVLRHRVQLTPEIAISGQEVDEILRGIIDGVPAPRI
jgi:MoxR-like ATPase